MVIEVDTGLTYVLGAYGIVNKAHKLGRPSHVIALEKIQLGCKNEVVPSTTLRELSLLKEMHDPNIVQLLEVVHINEHMLYLALKFLDMDLKKYMEALPVMQGGRGKALPDRFLSMASLGLDDAMIRKFMAHLVEGVRYCHGHQILHRDLKP